MLSGILKFVYYHNSFQQIDTREYKTENRDLGEVENVD